MTHGRLGLTTATGRQPGLPADASRWRDARRFRPGSRGRSAVGGGSVGQAEAEAEAGRMAVDGLALAGGGDEPGGAEDGCVSRRGRDGDTEGDREPTGGQGRGPDHGDRCRRPGRAQEGLQGLGRGAGPGPSSSTFARSSVIAVQDASVS